MFLTNIATLRIAVKNSAETYTIQKCLRNLLAMSRPSPANQKANGGNDRGESYFNFILLRLLLLNPDLTFPGYMLTITQCMYTKKTQIADVINLSFFTGKSLKVITGWANKDFYYVNSK